MNPILILILFAVLTRIVKIAKNKGVTDFITEGVEILDHLLKSTVAFVLILFVMSLI